METMTHTQRIALIVVGFLCLLVIAFRVGELSAPVLPEECQVYEDGSATCPEGSIPWDCTTMGNKRCGPVTWEDLPAARGLPLS